MNKKERVSFWLSVLFFIFVLLFQLLCLIERAEKSVYEEWKKYNTPIELQQ